MIKNIFYVAALALFVVGCADEPLPFETWDELGKGGFSRLTGTDNGTFFFTDPDNSSFTMDLEYYSENNGAEVAANEWYVRHRNNITGEISEQALVTTVSSFGTNANSGLPSASVSFTLNDALAAMGKTIDDLNGGDDIIFDGFVILNDGSRFGPDNTGNSIQGGAGFDGIFRVIKPLLCTSNLAGTYDIITTATNQGVGIGWDGCEGNTWEGQLRIDAVPGATGEYWFYTNSAADGSFLFDMSLGAYASCYGTDAQGSLPCSGDDGCLNIVDACNNLSWAGSSQWGEVFSKAEVSVNGSELTFAWTNDYGEGGSSVITRTDGSSWPNLK